MSSLPSRFCGPRWHPAVPAACHDGVACVMLRPWPPGGTGCWARSRCGWTAALLPLPGARQRLLLAVLLVNANRVVPAVRLIDELWGADLPADPRAALRTQVARLRRALGP